MISAVTESIPFERQQDSRSCGAAALCMIYRSLGHSCNQSDVWQRITRPGPWGAPRTNTKQLCADAIMQNLAALTLMARQPWPLLRQCASEGIRVILNHRLRNDSAVGHYSVLVRIDDEHIDLHDPSGQPERRLSKTELLELWQPPRGRSEIAGHVLLAVTAKALTGKCTLCGEKTPALITCPGCRATIHLQPAAVLGCGASRCPGRLWDRLFCPRCDRPVFNL